MPHVRQTGPVDLVGEQREYYRQRAGEYDQWWTRRGRYALAVDEERDWWADVTEVQQALDRFAPRGEVLEYACGSGWWTQRLVGHARRVTAVDSSAEMIALNRKRTANTALIDYVQADIFAWTPPPARFDVCFFSYWLSHVPADLWASFWATVAEALRPGGRVFLLDSYHPELVYDQTQQRVLNDGRRFTVIKRLWQPAELTAAAARLGWRLEENSAHVGRVRTTRPDSPYAAEERESDQA